MKKIVCMLLCAVMTVFFFGCGEPKWAESPVEDFEYEENEDGGITITRYIGEETEVVIPEKINEKNVTVIGKDAFSFILHLEFVKIPDTVTEIEDLAFDHNETLTEVFLSKNLKSIGYCAFEDCTALSKISLPSSLETMGDGAFIGCTALKTAVVGKNLKNWGNRVFAYTGLENLTLEEGLESIGHAAFLGTGLRKVTLSKGLTRVSRLRLLRL